MNELSASRLWLMRAGFCLLALMILFFQLLPLDTQPRVWAGPDLLLAFACAWSVRKPDYVPPLLLAAVFLLSDFLLQRPPGLLAVLALIGCENLKSRGRSLRDASFVVEWVTVSIIIAFVLSTYVIILALVMVDVPDLSLSLSELGMTVLFYPFIVAITHWLMGVRKSTPGDLETQGNRI